MLSGQGTGWRHVQVRRGARDMPLGTQLGGEKIPATTAWGWALGGQEVVTMTVATWRGAAAHCRQQQPGWVQHSPKYKAQGTAQLHHLLAEGWIAPNLPSLHPAHSPLHLLFLNLFPQALVSEALPGGAL